MDSNKNFSQWPTPWEDDDDSDDPFEDEDQVEVRWESKERESTSQSSSSRDWERPTQERKPQSGDAWQRGAWKGEWNKKELDRWSSSQGTAGSSNPPAHWDKRGKPKGYKTPEQLERESGSLGTTKETKFKSFTHKRSKFGPKRSEKRIIQISLQRLERVILR